MISYFAWRCKSIVIKKTIAILIDADNISPALVGDIFRTACAIGEPMVRRAYGMVNCFSSQGGWSQAQREYGIVARPQVSNVSGKNVADIALAVDAMELLYKSQCQGICIVSNDSDFTAVVAKIREGGKLAYGIGGPKAPESFRVACSSFHELPMAAKLPAKEEGCGAVGEVSAMRRCSDGSVDQVEEAVLDMRVVWRCHDEALGPQDIFCHGKHCRHGCAGPAARTSGMRLPRLRCVHEHLESSGRQTACRD